MTPRNTAMALLATLCAAALNPAAAAPPAQTAEGAQTFLRSVFDDRAKGTGWLAIAGQTRLMDGSNALLLINVSQIDDRDASGASNPCITAIRALNYSRIVLESSGVFYNPEESPLPAFPGVFGTPQFLDWGNASIIRSVGTTSTSTSYVTSATFRLNGSNGPNASFRLSTPDPDLAERIEYAMKFLKMSCEPPSSTGF